jgi:hypothetical protein
MRRGVDACVSGSRRVLWPTSQLDTGTARANKWLVVRGGDLSERVPLVGNWMEMLPTGRKQNVLPVMVLVGVLSPSCPESWHSRCQWCQKAPSRE